MKKNYFSTFFAALMLLVAIPATAQVSSMAYFDGKYQFTATINPTEAGQEYTDYWDNECEVTIASETLVDEETKEPVVTTTISGFLGAMQVLYAGELNTDKCEFYVGEPNPGYGLLDPNNGVGIADPNIEMKDFKLTFQYDPQTKEITVPDFSICTFTFPEGIMTVGTELAKVTNVKLTFAEDFTVADLSGDWHFVAEEGEQAVMPNSTLPTVWDMTLTATDEFNKVYDVDFMLGDFEPLELTATFDGQKLAVAFDNAYFDKVNMISLGDYNTSAAASQFEFTLSSENELTLTYGMCIVGEVPSFSYLQYYGAGVATRSAAEEEEAFTWVGTYTVTAKVEVLDNTYEYPETGEMEIAYDEDYNEYYVAKLFGEDLTGLWYYGNGIVIVPSAEQANKATINTIGAHGESIYLRQIESGLLLKMVDADGGTNPLNLEINEDGTISMDNFKVMVENNTNGSQVTPAAIYKNITIVKTNNDNAVENVIVENKAVMGIFDLLGRKLDAITGPGLYIVNGKKVVIK